MFLYAFPQNSHELQYVQIFTFLYYWYHSPRGMVPGCENTSQALGPICCSQSNSPVLRWGLRSLTLYPFLGWWVYQPGDVRCQCRNTSQKEPGRALPNGHPNGENDSMDCAKNCGHTWRIQQSTSGLFLKEICVVLAQCLMKLAQKTHHNLVKCLCRLQQETIEIARLKSEMPEVLNIGSGDIASGFQRWQRSPQPNSYIRGCTSSSDSKAVFSL